MEFMKMKSKLQQNFAEMVKDVNHLFIANTDSDKLWNLYLDSFPEGTNKMYRKRREYDCSCCRNFIKNIGNVVTIVDGKVRTIWDFNTDSETFQPVVDALAKYVKSVAIRDAYVGKLNSVGTDKNFEEIDGHAHQWDHFYLDIPTKFIDRSSKSIPDIQGSLRDVRNVFKRSLDEIKVESVTVVLELISQNSLYKGEEWKAVLEQFLTYKRNYDKLKTKKAQELFAWENSAKAGVVVGKIRNHSMGTLLVNISQEMDLDTAVKKYEAIVAPANYKRPKAIFTKKMLEDAKKLIIELGYMEALGRRFATLDDITVNNILFSNKDSAKRINGAEDIFGQMEKEISVDAKKFSRTEEISIEDFIKNVVPTAREIEALVENKHSKNMMSLIAPINGDAKTMFKWANGFSWAYTGNVTDSALKQNVKNAGGNVEGVLRFSIQWNDEERDENDLDAHCIEPGGNHIYFSDKRNSRTSGALDIDIINPQKGVAAVENITWTDPNKMEEGVYEFYVNNYTNRGGKTGFKAEIEFNGEIHSFHYTKPLKGEENVTVAEVTYSKANGFTIKEKLPSSTSSKDVWGVTTQQFVPVSVVMFSPNYWDEQQGIGNKHYFFMLKDCVNPECPNGFYNEFLNNELTQHKRVLEALGSKASVAYTEDQLSGLGFSSTKRDDLIVKVKGNAERVLKIKF